MPDSLPFDPPYIIKINGQEGDQWVEVREDGTEIPCAPPVTWPMQSTQAPAAPAQTTILNVPYAEKDEAKKLGAKWDSTRKKWYVPQGVNPEPFSRWLTAK